jgi:LemA protein
MGLTTIIVLAVLAAAALYGALIYNNLVRLKHNVAKTWSNLDISLKQRHDELPKLVDVCKEYMRYEQETLDRVIRARGAVFEATRRGDLKRLSAAETDLRDGIGQLFALAENYPGLKANDSFRHLAQRVSQLEETIADRRELYNDSVNLNNVRIEQVPDVLLARLLGFRTFDLLEFSDARADVQVGRLFA